MIWDENGWLRLKDGGVVPRAQYSSDLPEYKFPEKPECDYFDTDKLPVHYKTLRIPFNDKMGSLSSRKGYLRLYGHESVTSWFNQSLVARRLDAFHTETTVKMEFSPKTFQQMAGLEVIYDTYNFFYLYMSNDEMGNNVLRIVVRDSLKFYNPVGFVSIGKNTKVWLRVKIDCLKLQFSYSLDGENFENIGGELDCSNLADEAYVDIGHEGHTGTFVGISCQDLTGGNGGEVAYADFEYFNYKAK